ncbi:YcxB family protein [Brachyspira hyodysenteriae]|nr:YcxB family protein [Brachyspira hyodysenteriae]
MFKESSGVSKFNKEDIQKIDCTNRCIFFYVDEMSAIIIPKSYLSSDDSYFLLSYKK